MITQCFFVFSPLWLDEMQRYITAFTSRTPSLHHLGHLWKSFGGLMISSDSKWRPVEFRTDVCSNDHSMLLCLLFPLAWQNETLYHSFHLAHTQPTPPWTSMEIIWWFDDIIRFQNGDQLSLGLFGPMITQCFFVFSPLRLDKCNVISQLSPPAHPAYTTLDL